MILKQNCFVISTDEITRFHNGENTSNDRYFSDLGGQLDYSPITYNGSSYQRNRPKVYEPTLEEVFDKTIFPEPKKELKEIQHDLSKKSKIKIVNKITAWTRANKANNKKQLYNFITCTLTSPQIGTDKDFTKMQNVFFTYMRKYFNLKNYLYVLERQTKNTNNIHSHTIIDQYIPYERLNRVWCKILSANGYTFPSHNYLTGVTEIVSVSEAMRRYDLSGSYSGTQTYLNPKTNKFVKPTRNCNKPNPLDVETIYNLQSVSRYVTKYITKNDSKINTSVWNCSQSISRLWTGAIISASDYYASLSKQINRIITITLDNGYQLHVNLLKYYTKIQEQIFCINQSIII